MTRIKIGVPNSFFLLTLVVFTWGFIHAVLGTAGDESPASHKFGVAIIFMLIAWILGTVASFSPFRFFKLVYIKNNCLTVISLLPSMKKTIRFKDLKSVEWHTYYNDTAAHTIKYMQLEDKNGTSIKLDDFDLENLKAIASAIPNSNNPSRQTAFVKQAKEEYYLYLAYAVMSLGSFLFAVYKLDYLTFFFENARLRLSTTTQFVLGICLPIFHLLIVGLVWKRFIAYHKLKFDRAKR